MSTVINGELGYNGEQLSPTDLTSEQFTQPEIPEAIPGLEEVGTYRLLRLRHAAAALCSAVGYRPPKIVATAMEVPPEAVKLLPLLPKAQSPDGVSADDIHHYRRPFMEAAGRGAIERVASAAEAVGWRAPGRLVERKIEQRVQDIDLPSAIETARQNVASAEADVDFLATFPNPRQAFVDEVDTVAHQVGTAIESAYTQRVAQGHDRIINERTDDTPKGMLGLVTKVVRRVRSFFGFFKRRRNPAKGEGITAYDAAAGIEQAYSSLLTDPKVHETLPMLSHYVIKRLPEKLSDERWKLALMAPEILNAVFSLATNRGNYRHIVDGVHNHPHELRFATSFMIGQRGDRFRQFQLFAPRFLPTIRDILPTDGYKVRDIYDQVMFLLEPPKGGRSQSAPHNPGRVEDEAAEPTTKTKSLRDRFKRWKANRR